MEMIVLMRVVRVTAMLVGVVRSVLVIMWRVIVATLFFISSFVTRDVTMMMIVRGMFMRVVRMTAMLVGVYRSVFVIM